MAMNWPWVSRRAFDEAVRERDWLHEQVGKLQDALIRIGRHEAGLPELERQARKIDVSPMPEALQEHFASFWDQKSAKMRRAVAYRRHGRGESWESIMKSVMEDEAPEQPQATAAE